MINMKKVLLFICDYTGQGNDQIFLWFEDKLNSSSADQLVQETAELICHDYWLIAPSIYRKTKKLPPFVTDIEELRIASSGKKEDRIARDRSEIYKNFSDLIDKKTLSEYANIFNRKVQIDLETLSLVGKGLLLYADKVESDAKIADEWNRYIQIERGVSDYLIRSAADGIAIDATKLRQHKEAIDFPVF